MRESERDSEGGFRPVYSLRLVNFQPLGLAKLDLGSFSQSNGKQTQKRSHRRQHSKIPVNVANRVELDQVDVHCWRRHSVAKSLSKW